MKLTKLRMCAGLLLGMVVSGGLTQEAGGPVIAAEGKASPADSPEMVQTEAKLARLRELIRPQPGEYATNIARIAWERDPWEAAVKAAREGKPVIAYGLQNAGVTCGFG